MEKETARDHLDAAAFELAHVRGLVETLEQTVDEARAALTGDDLTHSDARQDELHEIVTEAAVRISMEADTIDDSIGAAQFHAELAVDAVPAS